MTFTFFGCHSHEFESGNAEWKSGTWLQPAVAILVGSADGTFISYLSSVSLTTHLLILKRCPYELPATQHLLFLFIFYHTLPSNTFCFSVQFDIGCTNRSLKKDSHHSPTQYTKRGTTAADASLLSERLSCVWIWNLNIPSNVWRWGWQKSVLFSYQEWLTLYRCQTFSQTRDTCKTCPKWQPSSSQLENNDLDEHLLTLPAKAASCFSRWMSVLLLNLTTFLLCYSLLPLCSLKIQAFQEDLWLCLRQPCSNSQHLHDLKPDNGL